MAVYDADARDSLEGVSVELYSVLFLFCVSINFALSTATDSQASMALAGQYVSVTQF